MQHRIFTTVFITGLSGLAGAVQAQSLPQCTDFPRGEATHTCTCNAGNTSGSVWGSGPYTGDSSLCAAATHAGVIGAEGGAVLAIAKDGVASYAGSTANGVTTRDWGSYDLSVELRRAKSLPTVATCEGFPTDADAVECMCAAGPASGSVWGSDPYTLDSSICAAARHVGYVTDEGGIARVLRVPGLERYLGTEENGVRSRDWPAYTDSFVFDWNHE